MVRELVALFVDDGSLAVAILGVVALAVFCAGVDAPVPVTGGILALGCLVALVWNVLTAKKKD